MAKDTFILKTDLKEKLHSLSDTEVGQLFRKVLNYVRSEEDIKLSEKLELVFCFIKVDLDKNLKKYQETCEKRKKAISERWKTHTQENTNEYKSIQMYANDTTDTDNEYDNEYDNELSKDNYKKKNIKKKKFGEYKNVLLTEKELQSLVSDYGDTLTNQSITYLDEYIEMKGYKAKSHYLCIRKWVVQAVKEHSKGNFTNTTATTENIPEWFGKNVESKEMTKEEQEEIDQLLEEFKKE